jgi:hypothetical protein
MTHSPDMLRNIREVLLRDLQKDASAFHKLKGGRNSQVFRVDCSDGSVFAVKAYFQSAEDQRDRMGNELRALRFLKEHGVAEIAAPRAADAARRIAVYDFVSGQALRPEEIGSAEIDQAIAFLQTLKALADSGKAAHFSAASEACFSINAILQNLDGRFRRLGQAAATHPALAHFLRDELAPARLRAGERCRAVCRDSGIPADREIPLAERTLSPSDFGFHNALRSANDRLVFLDFEYFGWDDPAKTVSDFLLHPAMQLSPVLKRRFFSAMIAAFTVAPALPDRVRAVYPLFTLKWCAILLNEFTLEDRARRCFADGAQDAWNEAMQLDKARRMLAHLKNDDRDFLDHT